MSPQNNALPPQEPGTKPARALPYQPNASISSWLYGANGQIQLNITMANERPIAAKSAHFSVYANAFRSGGPWQYTVAAGAATWVAGRHVWIQHQPAGTVPACGAPLDNLLQMFPILEVVRRVMTGGGECGNIDWTFLGVSMPGWVLIMAVTLGLVGIVNNIVYPVRRR